MNDSPSTCTRCEADLHKVASTMSRFNEETICTDCRKDEQQAPNYRLAQDTEIASVRAGDRNFPGIGLAPEDRAFLAEKLIARRQG